jgi:hypothetical protein
MQQEKKFSRKTGFLVSPAAGKPLAKTTRNEVFVYDMTSILLICTMEQQYIAAGWHQSRGDSEKIGFGVPSKRQMGCSWL